MTILTGTTTTIPILIPISILAPAITTSTTHKRLTASCVMIDFKSGLEDCKETSLSG
ncbi:hypothetical protein LCM00_20420 [Bacillus infantis]|uniref:hypothetical protein n=1 Tax=Bacillus infantis TaxID=324767 RepID=UPI001CD26693|nr:hypothetical protein [Bacillus infantis]MCA1041864.1 hypothetical protein [Bacillus infantis]